MVNSNSKLFYPEDTKFRQDGKKQLFIEGTGGILGPVKIQQAFPLTAPEAMLIIEDVDGQFLGMLQHYTKMDNASVAVVEKELEEQYFLPKIQKIHDIKDQFSLLTWDVDTDRGRRQFEVRNRRADIRWFSDTHVVIQDADGNKYEIADLSKLDDASVQKVEMEV